VENENKKNDNEPLHPLTFVVGHIANVASAVQAYLGFEKKQEMEILRSINISLGHIVVILCSKFGIDKEDLKYF